MSEFECFCKDLKKGWFSSNKQQFLHKNVMNSSPELNYYFKITCHSVSCWRPAAFWYPSQHFLGLKGFIWNNEGFIMEVLKRISKNNFILYAHWQFCRTFLENICSWYFLREVWKWRELGKTSLFLHFNLLVTRCTNKVNIQQLHALPTLYLCVV
jgi:hypothetical protein